MIELDQTLQAYAEHWVDMAPHVATLAGLAAEARTVVEFGVRGGVSTWAILDGLPSHGRLWSVDVNPCTVPVRVAHDGRWTFLEGDDLDPQIQAALPPRADLVFIDTSHEYQQTVAELAYAVTLDPRRIVLHDYVMQSVEQAASEFCQRESWRLVDNELPFGLATLEPI